MKNLFLIDGASGTGKSDLIKYVSEYNSKISFIKKYTTRKLREYEHKYPDQLDLIPISIDQFRDFKFDYSYTYGGHQYGFSKNSITEEFKNHNDIFIIIRDTLLIEKLKQDYQFINVISIFIYTDRDQIIERLENDKHSREDIEFRISRLDIAFKSYLRNPTFYDEVIINSASYDDYQTIIDKTFRKYKTKTNIDPNYIFVLMSFNPVYNEIFDEFVDAAKLVNESLVVKRIDKQRGDYRITDEILNCIAKARLIICDLTDERPNVYYELGYARGLRKKVIPCAKENTKLHFDIKDFRTIFYNTPTELRKEIISELKEYFE